MTHLTIIQFDGTTHHVEAQPGTTLMQAAVDALVPGILADCGGACSCATCHCYVADNWVDRLPAPASAEIEMLDCAKNPRPNSRLSCQIRMAAAYDGLVLHLPESQI